MFKELRRKTAPVLAAILTGAVSTAAAAAALPPPETPGNGQALSPASAESGRSAGKAGDAKLFTGFTPETFRGLDRAQQRIDLAKIDFAMLSAAVFHETNRRRSREGLPPLQDSAGAREAAQMQAEIMAARKAVTHVNPELPAKKTPADRLRLSGVTAAAFMAENVALAFGLRYQAGEQVYVRGGDKAKIFSRKPEGEPIPLHTGLSLAESLLDLWMASPGHRKNILSDKAVFFGAGLQPGVNESGMPVFYGVQVFFAPPPEGGRGKGG